MKKQISEFNHHATYISDYGFDRVRNLGLQEAFDILTASPYTDKKPSSWSPAKPAEGSAPTAYFLLNKAWTIVEVDRQSGVLRAVYNHDGRYSLHQISIPAFLRRIDGMWLWHDNFRKFRDELMQPNENA